MVFLPILFTSPLPNLWQSAVATIYSFLIGVVGFMLYFSAIKKIKISTASFLSYFEPVSAILFGVILFSEKLTWNMLVGGLLIIASAMAMKAKETKSNPTLLAE